MNVKINANLLSNGYKKINNIREKRELFNTTSNCLIEHFSTVMSIRITAESFNERLNYITKDEVISLTKYLFVSKKNDYDDPEIFKLVALSLKNADIQKLDKLSILCRVLKEKISVLLKDETYVKQSQSVQHPALNITVIEQIEYLINKSSELGKAIKNNQDNNAEKLSCEIDFLVEQFSHYRIQYNYRTISSDDFLPVINPDKFDHISKNSIHFSMNTRMDIFQNQIVGLYKQYLLFVLACHKKCGGELKSSDIRAFEKFLSIKRVRQIRVVTDVLHLFKYLITPKSEKIFKQNKLAYKVSCTTNLYLKDTSFRIKNTAQVGEIYHNFLNQKRYSELQSFIEKLSNTDIYTMPEIRKHIASYVFNYNGIYGSILTHLLRIKNDQLGAGILNNCIKAAQSLQRKSAVYKQVGSFNHNQLKLWICNYKFSNKISFISDMENVLLVTYDSNDLTPVEKSEVASYLKRKILPNQYVEQFAQIRESRNIVLTDLLLGGYLPNLYNYQNTRTFDSINITLDLFKQEFQPSVLNHNENTLSFTQEKISDFISKNEIEKAISYIKSLNLYSAYFALTENYHDRILIDQLFMKSQETGNTLFNELNDYWSKSIVSEIILDKIQIDPYLKDKPINSDPMNWSMKDFSTYVGKIKPRGSLDCLKHFYCVMAVIYMDNDESRQKNKIEYFSDIINRLSNRNKANNWQELRKVGRKNRAYIILTLKFITSAIFFIGGVAISATGIGIPVIVTCGVLMSILCSVLYALIDVYTEHRDTREYKHAKSFNNAFLETDKTAAQPVSPGRLHNGTFPLLKQMTAEINKVPAHSFIKQKIDEYFDSDNAIEKYFNETDTRYLEYINQSCISRDSESSDDEVLKKIEQILTEMQESAIDKYLMTQNIFRLARIIWRSNLNEQLKLKSFGLLRLLFDGDLLLMKKLLKTHRNFTFQNYYFITSGTFGITSKISNFSLAGLIGHDILYQPIIMLSSLMISQLVSKITAPFIDFVKKEPYAIKQNLDFLNMFIDFFEKETEPIPNSEFHII